jgi:hypothetical protein
MATHRKTKKPEVPARLKGDAPKPAPKSSKPRKPKAVVASREVLVPLKAAGRQRLTPEQRRARSKLPTNPRMALAAERREKMLELRIAGASERAIAKEMGLASATVHEGLKIAVEELKSHTLMLADDYRRIELERLDKMTLSLFTRRNDPRTADTLLRIMERRAKLLGLDSPTLVDTRNQTVVVKRDLDRLPDDDLAVLEAVLMKMEAIDGDANSAG